MRIINENYATVLSCVCLRPFLSFLHWSFVFEPTSFDIPSTVIDSDSVYTTVAIGSTASPPLFAIEPPTPNGERTKLAMLQGTPIPKALPQ
jgi:hypothetical protein